MPVQHFVPTAVVARTPRMRAFEVAATHMSSAHLSRFDCASVHSLHHAHLQDPSNLVRFLPVASSTM